MISDLYDNENLIPFSTWLARGARKADQLMWFGITKQIKNSTFNREYYGSSTITSDILVKDKYVAIEHLSQRQIKEVLTINKLKHMCIEDIKYRVKNNTIHIGILEDDWKDMFLLPRLLPISNKMKDLQYKIITRIFATNHLLFKMNKVTSPTCIFFYLLEQETIEHVFFQCIEVKSLWYHIFHKFNNIRGNSFSPSLKVCMFGHSRNNLNKDLYLALNTLLMLVKSYIAGCKFKMVDLEIFSFKLYLKNQLTVLGIAFPKYECTFDILNQLI